MKPPHPNQLSRRPFFFELALTAALMRVAAQKSSQLSRDLQQSSLAFTQQQSGLDGPPTCKGAAP
jgi:hypothetical protein